LREEYITKGEERKESRLLHCRTFATVHRQLVIDYLDTQTNFLNTQLLCGALVSPRFVARGKTRLRKNNLRLTHRKIMKIEV